LKWRGFKRSGGTIHVPTGHVAANQKIVTAPTAFKIDRFFSDPVLIEIAPL
jgi:hypothetical protein